MTKKVSRDIRTKSVVEAFERDALDRVKRFFNEVLHQRINEKTAREYLSDFLAQIRQ